MIFSGDLGHCGGGSGRGRHTAGVTGEGTAMVGRWKQAQTALPPRELESFLLLSPRNDLCNPSMEKGREKWAAPGRLCQASKPSPLKEIGPVLSGRLYLLPKAFSSHSGPTAILWDEVRCYPHFPSSEMLALRSVLVEVMRAALELKESFPPS